MTRGRIHSIGIRTKGEQPGQKMLPAVNGRNDSTRVAIDIHSLFVDQPVDNEETRVILCSNHFEKLINYREERWFPTVPAVDVSTRRQYKKIQSTKRTYCSKASK